VKPSPSVTIGRNLERLTKGLAVAVNFPVTTSILVLGFKQSRSAPTCPSRFAIGHRVRRFPPPFVDMKWGGHCIRNNRIAQLIGEVYTSSGHAVPVKTVKRSVALHAVERNVSFQDLSKSLSVVMKWKGRCRNKVLKAIPQKDSVDRRGGTSITSGLAWPRLSTRLYA
jgi:hypothetical protein